MSLLVVSDDLLACCPPVQLSQHSFAQPSRNVAGCLQVFRSPSQPTVLVREIQAGRTPLQQTNPLSHILNQYRMPKQNTFQPSCQQERVPSARILPLSPLARTQALRTAEGKGLARPQPPPGLQAAVSRSHRMVYRSPTPVTTGLQSATPSCRAGGQACLCISCHPAGAVPQQQTARHSSTMRLQSRRTTLAPDRTMQYACFAGPRISRTGCRPTVQGPRSTMIALRIEARQLSGPAEALSVSMP